MPIRDLGADPLSSSQSTMVTVESAEPIDTTATNNPVVVVETSNVLVKPKTEEKPNKPELVFSRPPESLSMRTHVSVTMEIPLKSLEPLSDDVDFFAHTSLCPNNHFPPRSPLSNIADALIYWEAIGAKPQDAAAAAATAASAKPPTTTTTAAASSSVTPTYGTASGAQIKQSLQSLYHLQKQAPLQYPFIYLVMRDFSVIFKMIPQPSIDSDNEPAASGHRRVAVLSQSYLGLRRILRTENVDFSMPLAPKLRSWNELQNDDNKQKMHVDKYHLQSTGVDKTWRSAVLIMDEENANGLFKHLQTVSLDNAQLFSTSAFVNGTMRKSTVRFSSAVSYEDHRDPSDQGQQQVKRAKNLYKLDIKGVVLPNAWHSVLMALAELPETKEKGFVVAAKERPETIHLNMLVSKQGSSVTGKRNISYDQGQFTYS
ncbi:hypothetical protein H4R99_006660 [Coemansia sp. RSA 1722]|nr:hypothetical protein IWW45_004899 [Coemansia sp. RSA 485]KAJ2591695.1 hypothetical protein H4R99_006660 [Coemansia sp. RSA 1722]